MADERAPRPVIIIKRKRREEFHGGSWKVALADFMSSMFALFVALWVLAQSPQVRAAVAIYFNNPGDYQGRLADLFHNDKSMLESKVDRQGLQRVIIEQKTGERGKEPDVPAAPSRSILFGTPDPASPADLGRLVSVSSKEEKEQDEVRTFLKLMDDLWAKFGLSPSFWKIKNMLTIQTLEEGLLVQLVEQKDEPLFAPGDPDLKPIVKEALGILAEELGKYPNKLEITGHGTSVAQVFPPEQKWMASAYMADRARVALEEQGFKGKQIYKVTGCADRLPLSAVPNDPLNRRICILVRPRQWKPEEHY
ncbi:MAG: flagellar motor protein MotB [Planctomycetota bacterium]